MLRQIENSRVNRRRFYLARLNAGPKRVCLGSFVLCGLQRNTRAERSFERARSTLTAGGFNAENLRRLAGGTGGCQVRFPEGEAEVRTRSDNLWKSAVRVRVQTYTFHNRLFNSWAFSRPGCTSQVDATLQFTSDPFDEVSLLSEGRFFGQIARAKSHSYK